MHLWLVRHAKSSWDQPDLDDHERPLAPRGVRAAAHLRDYLDAEGIRPALVLCSSAVRTRETLAVILPALGPDLEIRVERELYESDARELFVRLRDVPSSVPSAMLIGHNPAIQELTTMLASRGDRLGEVAAKFPTGALAEITFPGGSWDVLKVGSAELTRFVTPRGLEGG